MRKNTLTCCVIAAFVLAAPLLFGEALGKVCCRNDMTAACTKFNGTDCPYGWSADSHCCPPASETLFQAKIRDPEVEDERQAIDVEGK